MNLVTNTVFVSRDVTFVENIFPVDPNSTKSYMKPLPVSLPQSTQGLSDDNTGDSPISHPSVISEPGSSDRNISDIPSPVNQPITVRKSSGVSQHAVWMKDYAKVCYPNSPQKANSSLQLPTKPQIISNITCAEASTSYANLSHTLTNTTEPSTFYEAVKHPKWVKAMNSELHALELYETWDITDLLIRKKVIDSKWLFKVKYRSNGSVERNKARLVILGCRQKKGIDYSDICSCGKNVTVRAILAIAAM